MRRGRRSERQCAAGAERLLRHELEGTDVIWSDDGEMTVVVRCDRGCPEPFGYCDHGGVDGAERKVRVGLDELGRSTEIGGLEGLEDEGAVCQLAKQLWLGRGAGDLPDQIRRLGHHELRYD
jgi:hypothetical protein